MKQSEKRLLIITISIAVLSLFYIYLIEPRMNTLCVSSSLDLRNKKYLDILNRKDEIHRKAQQILSLKYWKNTPQEQQIAFQMYMETITREAGITQIKSVLPLQMKTNADNGEEIALQMEVECSVVAFSRLLHKAGSSEVPVQIRKLSMHGETGDPDVVRAQIEVATIWIDYCSNR
ncbi:MAG: hypothetical protein A2293_10355 [Elusimicrobia bacterium RIFOXYB2_FULL_49_7]|nr:MAG: hypothetical protein A2293_10355 [Elusimicrobia bacterium RIFOXYB2_FULL_49_7]